MRSRERRDPDRHVEPFDSPRNDALLYVIARSEAVWQSGSFSMRSSD